MTGTVEARLKDLGIELPNPSAPAANYIPYTVVGSTVFVSGQVCVWNGEIVCRGRLGEDVSTEDGYKAARVCGLNLISQVREACGGDLDRVVRVAKLGGFVTSAAGFTDQPEVINGASDLMVEVFGDAGKHSRFAVGAPSLPRGVAVEVDGIFEIR